jgi:hypothetical protein
MKIKRFNNDWDFVYHGSAENQRELGQIERVQYQNKHTGEAGPQNVLYHAHANVTGGKKEDSKKIGVYTSKEKAAVALKKFHQIEEGTLSASGSALSLLEEDFRGRLKKLGFTEQVPAQTKDGLSGVYRFDHPEYEIEARPKVDSYSHFKYQIRNKRTGRRHGSDHLTRIERFLANKDK